MKYLLITILAFMLISCGESKSDLQQAADVSQSQENNSDLKEKLSELEPISEQNLKDWMPEAIGTMKLNENRTRYYTRSKSASGEYSGGDYMNYSIVDGAAFPDKVARFARIAPNFDDQKDDSHSVKKVNKKNVFAIESTEEYAGAELQFIYADRFLITVRSSSLTIEQLWDLWDDYKLDALSSL